MTTKVKRPLAFLMSVLMMLTFSFSDGLLGLSSLVYADDGITGKAVQPSGDGSADNPYEIENYDNLIWFQEQVDGGNLAINAKLTADIIANEDLTNENTGELKTSSPKYTWTPICQTASRDYYSGTFDGNGYSISGLYYNDTTKYNIGLFGQLDGTIKNLIIKDSYFGGLTTTSAFAGNASMGSKIENCGSLATIKGSMYCGGIAGKTNGKIVNCYFAGNIDSPSYSNAITSDYNNYGTLINCYYLSNCGLVSDRATSKTLDAFKSGEVCSLLNNNVTDKTQDWYQTINTDNYPILDGNKETVDKNSDTVYMHYNEETSEKSYSNEYAVCPHNYEKGICKICTNFQKPELTNNVYQIANYGNLVWFQKQVDKGNPSLNADLTADITANEDLLTSDGALNTTSPQYTWEPICQSSSSKSNAYSGTFNGNGHFISGLYYNNANKNTVGLFGASNGTVKNLIIKDSYFGGYNYTSAFVGYGLSDCRIENCASSATIKGESYCGGIAGDTSGSITSCYFSGKITASTGSSNAIASDTGGTLTNCYYLSGCGLPSSNAVAKSLSAFASGEVCFLLNGGATDESQPWYQSIGSDSFPVLDKSENPLNKSSVTVYRGYNESNEKVFYSNTETYYSCDDSVHKYEKGICKVCGDALEAELIGDVYQIANYGNLVWFQQKVDAGNPSINAKLTADIIANEDLLDKDGELKTSSPEYTWTPIGQNVSSTASYYSGTFDGDGHFISGLYNYTTKQKNALFRFSNGTIKNLIIKDSYFSGHLCTSSFVGYGSDDCKIENCASLATIKDDEEHCGGIAGQTSGSITNCYFMGKISADASGKSNAIADDAFGGTLNNCYYLNSCGLASSRAKEKTADDFASGEVCFLLNSEVTDGSQPWYQSIGSDPDPYPILDKSENPLDKSSVTVYRGYDKTDGKAFYSNTESYYSCDDSDHIYEKGICKVCKELQEPELIGDVYQIANYGNLVWFQQKVDGGSISINAKLTADIIANEDLLDKDGKLKTSSPQYTWAPICQDITDTSKYYSGTFNGDGYSISGLYYNDSDKTHIGLFGRVKKGTIQNLIIKDSYFSGGNYTSSIVGFGTNVCTIENCASFATVKGGSYCGGVAGKANGSVTNCYFAGNIVANSSSNAVAYDDAGTLKNCYYLSNCGLTSSKATEKKSDAFASGEVCFLLNGGATDESQPWYQSIGSDSYPILDKGGNTVDKSSSTVYKYYDETTTKTGYRNEPYYCSHSYENGICQKCDAPQEPTLINGVYQIANYGNLVWFQQQVDGGNLSINAKLTADIIANEDLLNSDGELKTSSPKYTWTPICQNATSLATSYSGTFNGDGHFISGLYTNVAQNYVGLFSRISGTIQNLIIKDSYFSGKVSTSTFTGARYSGGTIENCASFATVKGTSYCGGIAGQALGPITNCYYVGNISATTTNSNAIAYDNPKTTSTLTNCFYSSNCGLTSERATPKTADELAEICEGVGFHSYADEKCLLCEKAEYGLIADYSLDNGDLVFGMTFSKKTLDTAGASVKVTLPSGDIKTYLISDATAKTDVIDGKTVYIFPLNVAPYELTKDIKVQTVCGDDKGEEITFSVRDNLKKDKFASEEKINALLNYGASVQKYFEYNTSDLANAGIEDTTDEIASASAISSYKRNKATNSKTGTFTGLDLVLDANPKLNAYFNASTQDRLEFYADGNVCGENISENQYVLSASLSKMSDLIKEHTFSVNKGVELKCSVLSYIYEVLDDRNGAYSNDLKKTVSSLLNYVKLYMD